MKHLFSIAFLILSTSVCAQFFKIKQLRDTTAEGGNLSFPIVESTQRPEVARRINLYLQMRELNRLVPSATMFENFSEATEYSNEIVANNERLLTFHFTSMQCLARCEQSETDYAFDARTGDFITLERLFTPEGLIATRHTLLLDWKAKAPKQNENTEEEVKECMARIEQMAGLPIQRFSVSANQISFWGEQCLGTAERSYDNPHSYFTKSFTELKPYLSVYGKSLLSGAEQIKEGTTLIHSVLRGKIDNKTPITLIILPGSITDAPDAVTGMLVYDQDGKTVDVRGFVGGNKVTLHEIDETTGRPKAMIDATWDGAKLTGTVKNLQSGGVGVFGVGR